MNRVSRAREDETVKQMLSYMRVISLTELRTAGDWNPAYQPCRNRTCRYTLTYPYGHIEPETVVGEHHRNSGKTNIFTSESTVCPLLSSDRPCIDLIIILLWHSDCFVFRTSRLFVFEN